MSGDTLAAITSVDRLNALVRCCIPLTPMFSLPMSDPISARIIYLSSCAEVIYACFDCFGPHARLIFH
jgi:hypothetical protein